MGAGRAKRIVKGCFVSGGRYKKPHDIKRCTCGFFHCKEIGFLLQCYPPTISS